MSSETIITGQVVGISELYFSRTYDERNRNVIMTLPEQDHWPELTRALFSVPNSKHIYRTQIICFGTSYKQMEREWDHGLVKLENVLRKLYWDRGEGALDSDIVGIQNFNWISTDTNRLGTKQAPIPSPVSNWGRA